MSVTFVAILATVLVATSNAAIPSFENRHLVADRPMISRNPSAYRLPATTEPSAYKIKLIIDPDMSDSFSGSVEIDITAKQDTDKIVIHAHTDMIVGNFTVTKVPETINIFASYNHSISDNHFLEITLNDQLKVGDQAKISIDFIGTYGDVEGLYLSTYKDDDNTIKNLATTQFQAVSAREAFPCYDEPHLKSKFKLVIYHPEKFHAISNTEEDTISAPPTPIAGYNVTQFVETPIMSTYLIAFIVSDFVHKSNTGNEIFPGKNFRVFARPNAYDSLDYSLNFAQRSLKDLEDYTDFKYALSKMDKAAIPDFSAGAMENWGLVTYREEYLLHKNGTTSTTDEQFIAAVISHENAHMWFGNEVTPMWWSYLWLSEGFATYFEYYTTDSVLNFQFRMMEQFVVTYLQGVMRSDATRSTNAMTNNLGSPAEIDGNFNGIAYDKSGSVIRMIQHVLGQEAFQKGLQSYIKKLTNKITEPKLLFDALDEFADMLPSNITINDVFESWSTQRGFPLVSALHTNNRTAVEIYQKRYYQDVNEMSDEQWYIPITWAVKENADFKNTSVQNWFKPEDRLVIDLEEEKTWFILNKQQMGYFRVMYDRNNWISLAKALNNEDYDGIHHLNRAQLLDDSYTFATSLRMSFNLTMDILSYLHHEDDVIVWITAERILNNFDIIMQGSDFNDLYRLFTSNLSHNTFEKYGIDASPNDDSLTRIHRDIALSLQCNSGKGFARSKANAKIAEMVTNPDYTIDPDLKSTIYCCGLRSSTFEEWDVIFEKYLEASRPTEKYMVLRTLGCTESRVIAERYLNMTISDDSNVDVEDRYRIVVAMINGGERGLTYALDFLIDEFIKFQKVTEDYSGGLRVISALQNRVVSGNHVLKFWNFRDTYNSTFTAAERSALNRAAEVIGDRNYWVQRALREINPWLEELFNSGGALANISKIMMAICAIFLIYTQQ